MVITLDTVVHTEVYDFQILGYIVTIHKLLCISMSRTEEPVSYTHLDVYKRQVQSDGFAVYDKFDTLPGKLHLCCWADVYKRQDVSKVKWRIILPVGARFARPKMVCFCIWAVKPCRCV